LKSYIFGIKLTNYGRTTPGHLREFDPKSSHMAILERM
jgi:hypothetical protein